MARSPTARLATQIDARVAARMEDGHWPGVALGIDYFGETLIRVYGSSDLEHQVPVRPETVFRIGSITKQFTAALVLKLQELGRLSVEDEVTRYLPDYPTHGRAITIHHLLTHTSGLTNYSRLPGFLACSREDLSREEVLALFQDLPLRFEPGADHEYCNSGYYLLGLITERVTGTSYRGALTKHILGPLGLGETSHMDGSPLNPHRASGYVRDGQAMHNAQYINMRLPGGAGALGSTVGDLLKWQRRLGGGALLSPASLTAMRSATALSTGEQVPYGYGVGIAAFEGAPKITHSGGINGFVGVLSLYLAHGLSIAVLTNIGTADPWALDSEVARLLLDLPAAKFETVTLSGRELEAIAGTYTDRGEPVHVPVESGGISWFGRHYVPIDRHTFVAANDPESKLYFEAANDRIHTARFVRESISTVYPRSIGK